MGKPQDRTVFQRGDGNWVNKRNDADKASSLHATQADANAALARCSETRVGEN